MIRTRLLRVLAATAFASTALVLGSGSARLSGALPRALAAPSGCQLGSPGGSIKHVIYIQFDNVHLTRDDPQVPSDLEQMPHLLNFIEGNGTMLSNNHTGLISHTATDILTSFTGLYGDHMGVPIANSYRFFNPDGTSDTGVSFAYWTDPIFDPATTTPSDTKYNMLDSAGKNTPAPWVPYTRAGCNFGGVATANVVLENIATDIPTVFGPDSSQAAEVKSNPAQAFADYVGIGVHCAQGNAVCSSANGGESDVLPDEPGGYSGYQGLFGHKYVAPVISPSGPLQDLNGNTIQDTNGHVGFPGFDGMSAAVTLSYVAAMQEHGVPVTYAYISDAHDSHPNGPAYGPGQSGYVAALKAYDDAFGKFFTLLANDGINQSNTLFVFTSDENDHFAGGAPTPANCDGVTTPCTYSSIGEVSTNLSGLLATQQGITTPFKVHSDDAPNVYVQGNPARTDPSTRALERAAGQLTAVNPITGKTDTLSQYLADPVEERLLHMVTADPARTPTFTLFGNPDYFMFTGATNCSQPCVAQSPAFAWNHGDVQTEITHTWLGLVGPGVHPLGVDNSTWADQTDVRPTMLALLGLTDDYSHDGRVLLEDMQPSALSAAEQAHLPTLLRLGRALKGVYATNGPLGLATLALSTRGVESQSDALYTSTENQLSAIADRRDAIGSQILSTLEGAEFGGASIDDGAANGLISRAWNLVARSQEAGGTGGFDVFFRSRVPGQGEVLFGSGPGCTGLSQVATQDQGAGTIEHRIAVTGNELSGTVGNNGIPGGTYWYETVTLTSAGPIVDNNGGKCYSTAVLGP
jgi:hypothetical protein